MSDSRRKFLRTMGLGLLGSTGLLLPNQAKAFFLGRRRAVSCPEPVRELLPVREILNEGRPYVITLVRPAYPASKTAATVYVTNAQTLFIWGTNDSTVTKLAFTVTDKNGTSLGSFPASSALPSNDTLPTDWAFSFTNLPGQFYLTASYQVSGSPATETWGPYTTSPP
jgi:hypothetical protein